jgi:N-acetyltransferase 10
MGYGTRAIELLAKYYQGEIISLNENEKDEEVEGEEEDAEQEGIMKHLTSALRSHVNVASLLTETIKPRKKLPPLLTQLSERPPERLHYLGVSYGVTLQLYRFWSKLSFLPVCIFGLSIFDDPT